MIHHILSLLSPFDPVSYLGSPGKIGFVVLQEEEFQWITPGRNDKGRSAHEDRGQNTGEGETPTLL